MATFRVYLNQRDVFYARRLLAPIKPINPIASINTLAGAGTALFHRPRGYGCTATIHR